MPAELHASHSPFQGTTWAHTVSYAYVEIRGTCKTLAQATPEASCLQLGFIKHQGACVNSTHMVFPQGPITQVRRS